MQTAVQAQMMMQGVVGVGGVGVGVGGMGVDEGAGILVEARQVEAVIEEGTLGMPGEEDEDDEDCDETADVEAGSGMDGSIAVMEDGTGNALNPMGEQAMMIDSNRRQRVRGISAAAGLQVPVLPVPSCRVEGCGEDLSAAGDYHRRHKVCKMHATSPKVINHGQEQRFCQQCSRFHALSEFDEGKRSCRKRLAGHNERRRRHQPDSLVTTSSESPPLLQGRESNKKGREWKSRGGRGRRGRSALSYSGRAAADGGGGGSGGDGGESISKRSLKSGEESYASIMNDAFARGDLKGKERRLAELMEKRGGEMDALDIDIPDMEQVKNGLDLGDGVVIPPLPFKRDGKPSLLKGWPQEGGIGMQVDEMEAIEQLRNTFRETQTEKSAWQHGDKETLLHCLWDCPKVQPVWRWAGRQLSKVRGSKVKVELRQGVFGAKLESWACAETVSVWRLLRGIILWQIWLARKGKISSGIEWNSGKVMRAAWVDLMMYAMQDWLEVLKKKECGKMDDAFELRGKFDSKWLVNQFAGRRAEWSMIWKDPDDVLLD